MSEDIIIEKETSNTSGAKNNWLAERKSHTTNIIALSCILFGYFIPQYGDILTSTGYFAFSGAITNWLAVHMLFEKIPFLYGSGVIPMRFEEFKSGIKDLILQQFFTEDNIKRFLANSSPTKAIQEKINSIDFEKIYQDLIEAIMSSSFGSMLGMLGGEQALEPLKKPIIEKLKLAIANIAQQNLVNNSAGSNTMHTELKNQIEKIVSERLNELTPQMVKKIIQDMIQKHLGWLVVWGGVFGGLIGAIIAICNNLKFF